MNASILTAIITKETIWLSALRGCTLAIDALLAGASPAHFARARSITTSY